MKHKIIWEKWNDPFGENLDDNKWNHYDNQQLDEECSILDDEAIKSKISKPIKVIASPVGIIPYNEYTASGKIFNFWVAHTNFNLSKPIVDIIEECSGVELLDIFTRYRFRIGIGKCFNDSETMNLITENVKSFLDELYENTRK
jgi:hypothetical protein